MEQYFIKIVIEKKEIDERTEHTSEKVEKGKVGTKKIPLAEKVNLRDQRHPFLPKYSETTRRLIL